MSKVAFISQSIVLLIMLLGASACGGMSPSSNRAIVQPTTYVVTLVCADCAEAGILINVWQNPGLARGKVVFQVPHETAVTVRDAKSADDGRQWYYVESGGKQGWIATDFVKR
jgi:hypothetical protein